MPGGVGVAIVLIFVLTLANGFFSASELAIVSARRGRLEQRARQGSTGAKQALALADQPDRFLATVQVGITLIDTFTAAFGGASISEPLGALLRRVSWLAPYAGPVAFIIVVVALTYLSLVLGELVPKRLALFHAEGIATVAAPVLSRLARLTRPVVLGLTMSANVVLRLLRQQFTGQIPVTEQDILDLTHEGASSGTVERDEERLIQRVFQLSDRDAAAVMTPRSMIEGIQANARPDEARARFAEVGFSRLPVYEDDLDNVVGVLHAKDLLRRDTDDTVRTVRDIMRPVSFVFEHQALDDLLNTFRREGTHLAMVIDEYGQVAGLITLEDVLEELVGDIADEFDVREQAQHRPIQKMPDGTWLVDGTEDYDAVRERVGLPKLEHPEYRSVAGLVLDQLERIPNEGDRVDLDGFTLEVVDMDGQRIDKIRITPHTQQEQQTGAGS
jgi:putative hemolysin